MSGGFEELLVNPNERAVSVDIMRLQRFKGADLAELWRVMADTDQGTDDLDAAGFSFPATTTESPLRGEILGGLLVRPQSSVLDLLVSPGVAFVLDPDAVPNPDESPYKFVRDPGIASTGVLAMSPNSSGQIRIDVIECARVFAGFSVLETDNRDVFNNTTGLFSATTLQKVTAGRLQYRVRQGSPGSGFPGVVSGWMPLAVASVPTGTTSNNTITFWDVRPLVSDRAFSPFRLKRGQVLATRGTQATLTTRVTPGKGLLNGSCEYVVNDRRLGGIIRMGAPSLIADSTFVDIMDPVNQSPAFSFATGSFYYVYLVTPFGLPRWARYNSAADGTRFPRSPRGILVVSAVPPCHMDGQPNGTVSLPTSTGLGGQTGVGVCIAAGVSPTAIGSPPPDAQIFTSNRWYTENFVSLATTAFVAPTGGAGVGAQATFTLTPGTTHPDNARALDVTLTLNFPLRNGTRVRFVGATLTILSATSGDFLARVQLPSAVYENNLGSDTTAVHVANALVPLWNQWPLVNGAPTTLLWNTGYNNSGATSGDNATSASLLAGGFEVGH